jgi:hypothetical protein
LGQHQWALEHIKGNHGPLGKLWPIRQFGNGRVSFLEGGGTIPWLGLVNKGLFDIEHPHWGGWSGRLSREKVRNYWSKHSDIKVDEKKVAPFSVYKEVADQWTDPDTGKIYKDIYTPVWRWRRAFCNDFVCRMDWCMKSFQEANHHPLAVLGKDRGNTIVHLQAKSGQVVALDASGSKDPDGDKLEFLWWIYKEAGTYTDDVKISNFRTFKATIKIPKNATGKQIHVILEVKDKNPIASLHDYRRIVIDVTE